MKASIIICTYNRSKLLKETIQSIQDQDFPRDQYEIIVVDNNSSDDTEKVVKDLASSSQVRIEYVFEGRQGLSHARNAGIRKAGGEIVAFTDDDAEADKSWLRELVAAFDSPEVGAAGGPIRPVWPFEKPEWITENWLGYFTVSDFPEARETGEFRNPNYPWGANMAFRQSILKETDLFPPALGRIGDCLLSNEELRLFRSIEEMGHRIVLAPDAVVHHKIPPERVRKLWLYHRTYWQGRSEAILDQQSGKCIHVSDLFIWDALEGDIECGRRFNKRLIDRLLPASISYCTTIKLADMISEIKVLRLSSQNRKDLRQHILNRDSDINTLKRTVDDKNNEIKQISAVVTQRTNS
jgi:glycosyltransferase involved in cell wall biosynthesis